MYPSPFFSLFAGYVREISYRIYIRDGNLEGISRNVHRLLSVRRCRIQLEDKVLAKLQKTLHEIRRCTTSTAIRPVSLSSFPLPIPFPSLTIFPSFSIFTRTFLFLLLLARPRNEILYERATEHVATIEVACELFDVDLPIDFHLRRFNSTSVFIPLLSPPHNLLFSPGLSPILAPYPIVRARPPNYCVTRPS